jgi:hypothetical protein
MKTTEIIKTYYSSLAQKNDKWKELWANAAIFSGRIQNIKCNRERCCDRIYYTILERSCIGISSAIDPYIQQSDFEKAEPITRAIYSIHVIRSRTDMYRHQVFWCEKK